MPPKPTYEELEARVRRLEKDLQDSRQIINTILDAAPVRIFWKDKDLRYLGCNTLFAKDAGFDDPKDMIGKDDYQMVWKRQAELYRGDDQEVIQSGKPKLLIEEPQTGPDGAVKTLLTSKVPLFNEEGELKGMLGAYSDITEWKEKEAEYAQLFALSIDMVCIADINTTAFLKVNPAFTETLGFSEEELLNESFMDFIHPDDVEKTLSVVESSLKLGKKVFNFENRYRCKDGTYRWLSWVSHPIPEIGKTYAVARDITSYKASEMAQADIQQELLKRNKFIEMILDYLPIGLGVNYVDSGEVTYLNRKFEEIYGWRKEEFPNIQDFFEKVFPDPVEREALQLRIMEDMASGDPKRMAWEDLEITTKTNQKRIVFAKNIPIFDQNLMISTVQDVTDKRKLEAQVQQAQKMESIGRLAGGVAHDFNNMLSIISGYSEMALEDLDQNAPIAANLQEIRKAAKRSADLTRQLLAFARRQTISPKMLDLNETIESMLKMLSRLIGEDIDLAWRPKVRLWKVMIDPSQVDQILANLCVNAKDAIERHGKITIETNNMIFEEEYCRDHEGFKSGEYVMIAVSDNGCGIKKENMDKLFEPFFTTKKIGQGTGLGLATVYGIVKQNNGFLNIYSEPGEGTCFKLYFPRYIEASMQHRERAEKAPIAGGAETVLVVEDEEAFLRVTQMMLERLGYQVLAAAGPKEAIQLAESFSGRIHLLMTDVVMPEMSGRDLAERLTESYPGMKCLFMSGYTANVIAHHGVLDEGINFINKPFSKHEVAIKVREALDQKT
ncbi:PAS domain S-box-containing protein [Desulfatibacillum alkenivorans DSM 16219]|jgi:PAS domain S-box-containing protein|uniref:histidine kinase n=1 Tax=Desulfatibacillum alkenivorans DSM 16219 TaxID=1121393 RepID=A0A1M6GRN6_9BACT|nr:PAS domain S-box protein [Desulfatibacillum alkenivorans]SHJ12600.1 PAS domain S-box-containing protein [Desulfatibacillum alkenivorans DSM 16219]